MNKRIPSILLCATVVSMGFSAAIVSAAASQGPTTRPTLSPPLAPRVQYVMSNPRTQDVPAIQFMCISEETTGAKLRATIDAMLPKLTKVAKDPASPITGPCMFVYHRSSADNGGSFRIDAGFPVQPNATAANGFTLKRLEPATCAITDFHGNAKFLPEAHEKLLSQITAAGNQPGAELREIYLHFSAAKASDVRLQVPLADRESMLAGHRSAD